MGSTSFLELPSLTETCKKMPDCEEIFPVTQASEEALDKYEDTLATDMDAHEKDDGGRLETIMKAAGLSEDVIKHVKKAPRHDRKSGSEVHQGSLEYLRGLDCSGNGEYKQEGKEGKGSCVCKVGWKGKSCDVHEFDCCRDPASANAETSCKTKQRGKCSEKKGKKGTKPNFQCCTKNMLGKAKTMAANAGAAVVIGVVGAAMDSFSGPASTHM